MKYHNAEVLQHNVRRKAPGTLEAIDAGCICARMDNGWERWHSRWPLGRWWITGGCPLHAPDVA